MKDSLTVIEHGSRQSWNAAELLLNVLRSNSQGIFDSDLPRKLNRVLRVPHDIKLQSNDRKPMRAILIEELLVALAPVADRDLAVAVVDDRRDAFDQAAEVLAVEVEAAVG